MKPRLISRGFGCGFACAGAARVPLALEESPLLGRAAILVPAWHEDEVIGHMITHTLKAWTQRDFVVYVGCYRNDPATLAAVSAPTAINPRLDLGWPPDESV